MAGDWPLNSIKLLGKIKDSGTIPLTYGFFNLLDKVDAVTHYIKEHNVYTMQINKNKVKNPLENSCEGRPNFTICHETGHIVLGHLLIPKNLKTEEEIAIEELEADEFAARLLMPKKMLLSCNFYSLSRVAEYFLVSKTALWKRLNNMKSLYTLRSKRINTCTRCGNTRRFLIYPRRIYP